MSRFTPSDQEQKFLRGDLFSSGGEFRTYSTPARDRFTVIRDEISGKSVLHVGFADHAPLIAEKRAAGLWLHDQIVSAAATCHGLDLNENVVAELRAAGVANVWAGDVTRLESLDPSLREHDFQVIVLGEVLEHVGNPVAFLSSIRTNLASRDSVLICTVPNAWSISTLRKAARGVEFVNTDHRFWFTPYTLAKVLTDGGYVVDSVETCRPEGSGKSLRSKIRATIHRRLGLFSETLVAKARVVSR